MSSTLPLVYDFQTCGDFPTGSSGGATISCVDGEYRVQVTDASGHPAQVFPVRFSRPVASLATAADVHVVHAPAESLYGVMCLASRFGAPLQGLLFVVSLSQHQAVIVGVDETDASLARSSYLAPIAHARIEPGVVSTPGRVRVGGSCRPLSGGKTRVEMTLNGTPTVRWFSRTRWKQFTGTGFYVLTRKSPTDIRFDNLTARR